MVAVFTSDRIVSGRGYMLPEEAAGSGKIAAVQTV